MEPTNDDSGNSVASDSPKAAATELPLVQKDEMPGDSPNSADDEDFEVLFKQLDSDNSGDITRDELEKFILQVRAAECLCKGVWTILLISFLFFATAW